MNDHPSLPPAIRYLMDIARHREIVQHALERLATDLRQRAHLHDQSKLRADEAAGLLEINRECQKHDYGTPEYREVLKRHTQPGGCIQLHNERNSHHPEHWPDPQYMGFLDIIEMVCDWFSASQTYGTSQGFAHAMERQRKRFATTFTREQWWLIEQVASWIDLNLSEDTDG